MVLYHSGATLEFSAAESLNMSRIIKVVKALINNQGFLNNYTGAIKCIIAWNLRT
ncbi:MAG: hypothetical protein K0S47_4048 [Herbinix sp.]|jgi:hypothetical protein|nr:hypothetical protein [Herbinix sp.]